VFCSHRAVPKLRTPPTARRSTRRAKVQAPPRVQSSSPEPSSRGPFEDRSSAQSYRPSTRPSSSPEPDPVAAAGSESLARREHAVIIIDSSDDEDECRPGPSRRVQLNQDRATAGSCRGSAPTARLTAAAGPASLTAPALASAPTVAVQAQPAEDAAQRSFDDMHSRAELMFRMLRCNTDRFVLEARLDGNQALERFFQMGTVQPGAEVRISTSVLRYMH
jgi:hypothetical protein